jgi:hypothetical protein
VKNRSDNFDNDDISRLLGSLKQVDPPGDFDTRVRARIAHGRPSAKRSWMPVPVGATLLVMLAAGYFGLRSYYGPATIQEASVIPLQQLNDQPAAEQKAPPANPIVVEPTEEQTRDRIASKPPEMQPSIPNPLRAHLVKSKTADKERGGGNRDSALTSPNVMTAPELTRNLSKEVLSTFGIEANDTGAGWTVGDVKQNSRAQRSGLKTGDVIESLKNNSLRVHRDGKTVQITLVP